MRWLDRWGGNGHSSQAAATSERRHPPLAQANRSRARSRVPARTRPCAYGKRQGDTGDDETATRDQPVAMGAKRSFMVSAELEGSAHGERDVVAIGQRIAVTENRNAAG